MNVSGSQYSRATKGIKDPKDIIDQQLKLVFVYPMLFDSTLMKYQNQLRDFVTVNMLKEIFVSNALDIISSANKIHPLIDEMGDSVDVQSSVQNIKFSNESGVQIQVPQSYSSDQAAEEIRRRVQEKTAVIRNVIKADPKLSSFRPYLEMITMENMIDVPVITGTKSLSVDTNTMMMLLIIAITSKQNLRFSSKQDIDKMFQILENTKPEEAHNLFDNILTALEENESLFDKFTGWFSKKMKESRYGRKFLRFKSKLTLPQTAKGDEVYPSITPEQSFQILQAAQDKTKQTEIFFKFALDKDLLKRQFGIDLTQGQTSGVVSSTATQEKVDRIFNQLESNFSKTISLHGNAAITSMINLLKPLHANVDVNDLRDKKIGQDLMGKLSSFVHNKIREIFENAIQKKDIQQAGEKLDQLNKFCTDNFGDSDEMFYLFSEYLNDNYISTQNFDENDLNDFIKGMDTASSKAINQIKRMEKFLSSILGMQEASSISEEASSIFDDVFQDIKNTLYYYDPNYDDTRFATFVGPENMEEVSNQLINSMNKFFLFLFYYNLQVALCNLVQEVKVDIETAKNSVVDYPNYTIVLPVETVMALITTFTAKSYEEFTKSGKLDHQAIQNIQRMNQNNIKKIVEFLTGRLEIPNLMVIDEKNQKLYYKLMHQSSAQQMNLRTIDNYIDQVTSEVLEN